MAIGEPASNIVTLLFQLRIPTTWMIQLLHQDVDKEDVTSGSGFIELRLMIFCNPLLCHTSKSFFNFFPFLLNSHRRVANTSRVSKLFFKWHKLSFCSNLVVLQKLFLGSSTRLLRKRYA